MTNIQADDIGHAAWRFRLMMAGGDTARVARAELEMANAMVARWQHEWRAAGFLSEWPGNHDSVEVYVTLVEMHDDLAADLAGLSAALREDAAKREDTAMDEINDARRGADL